MLVLVRELQALESQVVALVLQRDLEHRDQFDLIGKGKGEGGRGREGREGGKGSGAHSLVRARVLFFTCWFCPVSPTLASFTSRLASVTSIPACTIRNGNWSNTLAILHGAWTAKVCAVMLHGLVACFILLKAS